MLDQLPFQATAGTITGPNSTPVVTGAEGSGPLAIVVSGTISAGGLNVSVSQDGKLWLPFYIVNPGTSTSTYTITAAGTYTYTLLSPVFVQVAPTANFSGNVAVTIAPGSQAQAAGGGGGGGAMTVADGADVAEGATAATAVTGDNPGTLSGKLRGLLKIITSCWDTIGSLFISGNVAAGTTDSGNPVKVGGVASSTAPAAPGNGQRQNLWLLGSGNIPVTLVSSSGSALVPVVNASEGLGNQNSIPVLGQGLLFNGTSWDRQRNNLALTPLALSAATKATRTSAPQTNFNGRGLTLAVTLANLAGAATITPSIVEVFASGATKTIWTAAAALNANGTAVYQIYPGVSGGSFTEKISAAVGRSFQVVLTYAGNGTTDAVDTTADLEIIL